jgi:competence protein ComEC
VRVLGRLLAHPLQALAEARGILFPWAPVFIACGAGWWFALPWEPGIAFYLGAAAVLGLSALGWRLGPELAHPFWVALGCLALGVLAAGGRAHLQAAPILGFRYYGPIEGRIVEIDRSQADLIRLTLDRVVLERVAPERTPVRVRISLHHPVAYIRPEPGLTVMTTGHLAAPPPPSEPNGFDFPRMAFFERLGAVGYTRAPLLALEPPAPGEQRINRLRARLSAAIQSRIPGQPGAFAAGAVTGDRSAIAQATVEDLRASNLSHLLAISGMNMAFLTGFVFAALRYGLALIPALALRLPGKKLAALLALAVAAFYLALSGFNVATERAFVMVAVMLGAVLFDRRALSLRSVAISATILLLLQPEALLSPGFQMSFAATVALIAGFGMVERRVLREQLPRWTLPLFTALLSTLIAGFATAPYGAAHFNRYTDYGLLANLLTVPTMGLLVMPGAVIAALLAPLGLAAPGLWLMELGARWILGVAHWIAGWDGAVTGLPTPGPWVLPLLTLGALWVVLWRGPVRLLGLGPMVVAFGLWATVQRPPLLVSPDGALLGLMTPLGRALSAASGAGFAAETWLQNDGDLADQPTAAARAGFDGPKTARRFTLGGAPGLLLKGKDAPLRLAEACRGAGLVILAGAWQGPAPSGCRVIDQSVLARTGAIALWPEEGRLRLQPAVTGARLWRPAPKGQ